MHGGFTLDWWWRGALKVLLILVAQDKKYRMAAKICAASGAVKKSAGQSTYCQLRERNHKTPNCSAVPQTLNISFFFWHTIISYHLPKKRYNIIYIMSWIEWYDRISYIIWNFSTYYLLTTKVPNIQKGEVTYNFLF
jgi:hypothetical protein